MVPSFINKISNNQNEITEILNSLLLSIEEWKMRRLVHVQYYNLYHMLLVASSIDIIAKLKEKSDIQKKIIEKIYRSPSHSQCKELMNKILTNKDYANLKIELSDFANIFLKLHYLREEADYNPFFFQISLDEFATNNEQYIKAIAKMTLIMKDEGKRNQLTLALHFKDRR